MELFKASKQWATRPADERFWTVGEMVTACKQYADNSVASTVRYQELRVEARDQELILIGKKEIPAKLTHYSFGQVSGRVKAPPSYLRTLPPTLAAQNINYGLKCRSEADDSAKLLLHNSNNGYLARCFTSDKYQRIWNYEIGNSLSNLEDQGWRVPPARPPSGYTGLTRFATARDVLSSGKLGLSVTEGMEIAPSGVYASDRDLFVFMINDSHVLSNPASPGVPLAKGFFIWNSEVGDKSFGIMTFLYDHVCGNHIVWGASDVKEFRIRHMGLARAKAFRQLQVKLRYYADSSVSDDEAKILKVQSYEIGESKEEVIETLLKYISKKKLSVLSKDNLNEAYEIAEDNERYGNPRTPWAIAQGVTVLSQKSEHASRRVHLDQAAGKLLEIAF